MSASVLRATLEKTGRYSLLDHTREILPASVPECSMRRLADATVQPPPDEKAPAASVRATRERQKMREFCSRISAFSRRGRIVSHTPAEPRITISESAAYAPPFGCSLKHLVPSLSRLSGN